MNTLTPEQYAAMNAHRVAFIVANPNRCNTERKAAKAWKDQLTRAWLNDWREQWGELRTIRNTVGIAEAFAQFDTMHKALCDDH